MPFSQAVSVKLKYVAETTAGTTPAAAMTLLRYTTSSFNLTIGTTTSSEIVTTRDYSDLVRVSGTSGGDIGFEYSFAEYRPFVESALGGTFSTAVAITSTGISVDSTTNTISGFTTTNILAGHWIKVAGFTNAGNNSIHKVTTVATTSVVISSSYSTLVTETAGATITVSGRSVRNSTLKKTFSVEEEYSDLTTTFAVYKGQQVNTMALNAASGSIINGSFGFMGMTGAYGAATAGTGAEVAASTNPLMSAQANIGTVYIDGVAQTGIYFKNINLTTTNQARALDAINNLYPIAINLGSLEVKLATTVYFSDTALLTKFTAGTAFSLVYSMFDSSGHYIVVDCPNCKFDSGTLDGKSLNSEVLVNLSITALRATAAPTYTLQISELG